MAQSTGKSIARRRSLINQQLKELGEKAPKETKFQRAFFASDEEKPEVGQKKPKRRSLLTRLLNLLTGRE